jgi:Peptidase inhibitor family I36
MRDGSHIYAVPVVRRVFLGALVALALLTGALFAAAPKASAQSCVANHVCIWDQINYNGAIHYYSCNNLGTYSTPFGNPYRSAKNRCGNKSNVLNTPWGGVCMNPGGDRPSPGYFASVTFYNWGQTC